MIDSGREIRQLQLVLAQWFPGPAFARVARIAAYPILPEEQALVANAVGRRQDEFATGRWLSRQGLRVFGLPDAPIGMGRLRNPLWPAPVMGTISHDHELCGVVLVQKPGRGERGIGIDLVSLPQRAGRMDELAPMFVTHPGELEAMASFEVAVDPALLLFSVKESVIKALSFRLDDFIDMRAIEIRPADESAVAISGHPARADLLAACTGNFLVTAARVF